MPSTTGTPTDGVPTAIASANAARPVSPMLFALSPSSFRLDIAPLAMVAERACVDVEQASAVWAVAKGVVGAAAGAPAVRLRLVSRPPNFPGPLDDFFPSAAEREQLFASTDKRRRFALSPRQTLELCQVYFREALFGVSLEELQRRKAEDVEAENFRLRMEGKSAKIARPDGKTADQVLAERQEQQEQQQQK